MGVKDMIPDTVKHVLEKVPEDIGHRMAGGKIDGRGVDSQRRRTQVQLEPSGEILVSETWY